MKSRSPKAMSKPKSTKSGQGSLSKKTKKSNTGLKQSRKLSGSRRY